MQPGPRPAVAASAAAAAAPFGHDAATTSSAAPFRDHASASCGPPAVRCPAPALCGRRPEGASGAVPPVAPSRGGGTAVAVTPAAALLRQRIHSGSASNI